MGRDDLLLNWHYLVHLHNSCCVPALICIKTGRCDWHMGEQGHNELCGTLLHLMLKTYVCHFQSTMLCMC